MAHNAYPTLTRRTSGFIGGVEWQTTLLARWLANRGHHVVFITWDEGGPGQETVDGITILKTCREGAGLPGIRFISPKWTSLASALSRAECDVYYHNCGEGVTGQIALWCQSNRRGFVFTAANDTDCDYRLPELAHLKDRLLYRYGLKRADVIIVQTKTQQGMMQTSFHREATIIPMPCIADSSTPPVPRASRPSDRVLWVGRVCRQKRPDRLVEVAKMLPTTQFDLVGPHSPDAWTQRVMASAKGVPNISIHGRLDRTEVAKKYQESALLLCTSDFEGFPNTFLEAWSFAVPVVSTFDPDHVIRTRNLGRFSTELDELKSGIVALLSDPTLYQSCSARALEYFRERHDAAKTLPQFEQIICNVAEQYASARTGERGDVTRGIDK